jgi:hypothetical protein
MFVQFPMSRGIVDNLLFAASKFLTFKANSPSAFNSFSGISLTLESLSDTIPVDFHAFSREALADLDFERAGGPTDDGVLDTQPITATNEDGNKSRVLFLLKLLQQRCVKAALEYLCLLLARFTR